MKIGFVIPTLNAAKHIGRTIADLRLGYPSSEIIVVDENSTDKTRQIAEDHGCHVYINPNWKGKLGYGQSLIAGLKHAVDDFKCDLVFQLDADHPVQPIREMHYVLAASKFDMVIGFEYQVRTSTKGASWIARKFLGLNKFRQPTCGLRGYKKKALNRILNAKLDARHNFIHIQMLHAAKKVGLLIGQIGFSEDLHPHGSVSAGRILGWLWSFQKFVGLKFWFPVFIAFAVTFAIAMWHQYPIGVDVHFHLRIAEAWARGENGMFCELVMRINKMPYPPLLHFLLLPVVMSSAKYFATALFQMWILPLAVASIMLCMWKLDDNRFTALFAGMLVLGSFAYLDRTLLISPQGLNIIFMPLAMIYFVKRRLKLATAFATAMIYTHGVVGISLLSGIWLWALRKKRWKYVVLPILLSLPILLPTVPYLVTGWNRMAVGSENDQERAFWASPLFFTLAYQRFPFIGFFLAAYLPYKWKKHVRAQQNNSKLLELQKIAILTLATMAIMIYPWADRYVQFSVIPLSMLIAPVAARSKYQKTWLMIIYLMLLLMYCALWLWLFADSYTVLPEDYI